MPIELNYNEEKQYLYAVIAGKLINNEMSSALEIIVSSDNHPPNVDIIWDLTQISFDSITPDLAIKLTQVREKFPQRANANAAVVITDELGTIMAHMHTVLSKHMPQNIHIFKTIPEAESWLLNNK